MDLTLLQLCIDGLLACNVVADLPNTMHIFACVQDTEVALFAPVEHYINLLDSEIHVYPIMCTEV